ncbi:MAG: hypothetical protein KGI94_11100, partial [Paracoccaceae bacterium]|nr:hypothetical protein [Paracoccaceae bacterium]
AVLTQRFVDRRTSVLMRRLKQKETLVAEVNDKGEVTVEGEFVGRLEGFRFRQDASASAEEARTLRQAAVQALKPEFSLRADRIYNAPDTEFDYTEQGGLMWGTTAVGKLVKGSEPLKPQVEAFVDEEAGADVAEKVRRRLQHFIDRKVAALYDPLLAMSRDETLTGLARGFAFRMAEALGILPRDAVADEVKALDQEARAALRKHGLRFGQFTIFLPALLKPAPTRLRLVLWSLDQGLSDFPSSPPPGLVTIPNLPDVPREHYTLAGYRPAGARAIRIDMLERLADLLRAKDSRAGFEATADMLSITGMTLEQFADLMGGLGYRADKGEREKPRPEAVAEVAADPQQPGEVPAPSPETPAPAPAETPAAPEPEAPEAPPSELPGDAPAEVPEAPPAEMETFYTFTWAPRPRGDRRGPQRHRGAPAADGEGRQAPPGDRPERRERKDRGDQERGKGKPHGKGKPQGKGPRRDDRPKHIEAAPPRREKPIDPDNPFAVLAALRDRT